MTRSYQLLHALYFNYILTTWVLSLDASCIMQLVIKARDLNEVIEVFIIFATALAVLAKFLTIKMKNHLYRQWCEIIESSTFRPNNEREIQLFQQSERLARLVRNAYCVLSFIALNMLMFIVDDRGLPLSVYSPFDMNRKWGYLSTYGYQYITASICCYLNIAFDSLSASFLIHLKGQMDILCDRLKNFGKYSKCSDAHKITEELKNCIKYYEEILKVAHLIEDLISLPISIQIVCSVLVLVANFFGMAFLAEPGDYAYFFKVLIYQLCMLSQIYILCYFPNEVTDRSQTISRSLYSAKWFAWSQMNRKLTLLMMDRFDVPIRFKSINPTYSFNLAAFTSVFTTNRQQNNII
uniref:Odorant receptor n=1 Tax=Glossina austeni TaxID=7395 RepID=A0A1A9UPB8_GLOAU